MRRALCLTAVLVTALTTLACSGDPEGPGPGDDPLPPPAEGEGYQVSMTTMAPAGTEIWTCQISELPNQGWLDVGEVRSVQSPGVHHMDISTLIFTDIEFEAGVYDCNDVYRQYPQLMDDAMVLYAAQRADQKIVLPAGTVAHLPPHLKVMHELHYVNGTEEDAEVFSKINMYRTTVPATESIWGGAVRDTNLTVPPGDSVEWTRCVMTDDVDVLFLSSHTHQLATSVEVRPFDGTATGDVLYTNTDWRSPALETFAQPLHVAKGSGFEFSCNYRNPTAETVHWGFRAADEMCQIALVYTPGEATRKCEIVETSDGVLPPR